MLDAALRTALARKPLAARPRFSYDRKRPLDLRLGSTQTTDGIVRQALTFDAGHGRKAAYWTHLLGSGPWPVVLFSPGSDGTESTQLPDADRLAEKGVASLTVAPPSALVTCRAAADVHAFVNYVVGRRRALDLLAQLPDADPSRVVAVGFSFGAAVTADLVGVDHRVRGAVIQSGRAGGTRSRLRKTSMCSSGGMAQVLPAERDLRRVIGDADGAGDREVEGLGEQELLDLYRSMVLLRTYDERSVVYHRQGRIGTYAIFWNHEAMQAGAFHALADEDWIFPSYRESAIGLLRGMPPATVLSWWRGHPAGWWNPEDYRVASICVPIGTHVPHAAGLAWGKKLKGERAAAIVFFGDGATSEGSFHEGANFAAVTGAPLILFCNNNYWAISTPLEAQTRAETLADKAVGYGMPGLRVDGTDVLACYEATREAVSRARAGDGPTFVEAVSYRTAPHATADDARAYIDLDRVEEEKKRECVGRFEGYLRRSGILHDDLAASIRAEAADALRAGIAAAEAEPPADVELLFAHAFVDPPDSFGSDLEELRRTLG